MKRAKRSDVLTTRALNRATLDRQLLLETARASVAVMREKWDASEGQARKAVLEYGIQANAVDMAAFREAARPLREEYLRQPDIQALHRRIRDFA